MTELDVPAFFKFVSENCYAVIHFWAEWNCDDRQTRDVVAALPAELSQQIAVGAMNTDKAENWDVCREHRLLDAPALAFYRNGKPFRVTSGLPTRDELITRVTELLTPPPGKK